MAHENFRVDPLTGKLTMVALSGGGTELPQASTASSTLSSDTIRIPPVVIQGRSVMGAAINLSGHLVITFSDATSEDLGVVKGATGITNAKTILSGSGAPVGGTGTNGDFYIDTVSHSIYGPKGSPIPGWGTPTSIAFVPNKATLSQNATDLASVLALVNELKAALVANGFAN